MRYMKRNVLIYGAGLMGRGIAQVYARIRNIRYTYMILKIMIQWEKLKHL